MASAETENVMIRVTSDIATAFQIDDKLRAYTGRVVVVTGASGVAGAVLCGRASSLGADVIALTRRPELFRNKLTALGYLPDRVIAIPVDLTDADRLAEVIALHRPDIVVHLASLPIVSNCERCPTAAWEANCTGSFNLAEVLRVTAAEGVVVSTSDKAYGIAPRPYREDSPLRGGENGGVYEMTKAVQEVIFRWLGAAVPTVILRCCNLVGLDLHLSRIIPATIVRLMEGKRPRLWRDSATHVRTYVDARDAADAFLLAGLVAGQDGVRGEALNVANPANAFTSQAVVERVMRAMDVHVPIEFQRRRIDLPAHLEIAEQTVDVAKIQSRLGWTPRHTFDETLEATIEAYRKYLCTEAIDVSPDPAEPTQPVSVT